MTHKITQYVTRNGALFPIRHFFTHAKVTHKNSPQATNFCHAESDRKDFKNKRAKTTEWDRVEDSIPPFLGDPNRGRLVC